MQQLWAVVLMKMREIVMIQMMLLLLWSEGLLMSVAVQTEIKMMMVWRLFVMRRICGWNAEAVVGEEKRKRRRGKGGETFRPRNMSSFDSWS